MKNENKSIIKELLVLHVLILYSMLMIGYSLYYFSKDFVAINVTIYAFLGSFIFTLWVMTIRVFTNMLFEIIK